MASIIDTLLVYIVDLLVIDYLKHDPVIKDDLKYYIYLVIMCSIFNYYSFLTCSLLFIQYSIYLFLFLQTDISKNLCRTLATVKMISSCNLMLSLLLFASVFYFVAGHSSPTFVLLL